MKLGQTISRIKKIIIYISLALFIVLIIIGFIANLLQKEEKKEEAVINPVFNELPQPTFAEVPGITWGENLILRTNPELKVAKYGKSVEVYKLNSVQKQASVSAQALEIAGKLGYSGEYTEEADALVFGNSSAGLLRINKSDLSWYLENPNSDEEFALYSIDTLKTAVKLYLTEHGFYNDILKQAEIGEVYYEDTGYVLQAADTYDTADFVEFTYHLAYNQYPIIFYPGQDAVITVLISKFGNIRSIQYGFSEILFNSFGYYPLREFNSVYNSVSGEKSSIVYVKDPSSSYLTYGGEVTSFEVSSARVIYYPDLTNNFLVPVWEFEGSATLYTQEEERFVVLKTWVPGVSGEWLE